MPRKPFIILLLLLLLSIGGAVVFHQLRKDPRPPFTEVDAFLRQESLPADWRLVSHESQRAGIQNSDWTKWFGVRRTVHVRSDDYDLINERTSYTTASISLLRRDNQIVRVNVVAGRMYLEALEAHFFGKFPALNPYNARTGLP